MIPSFPSTLPSKPQRPPSHPSSSRTLSRSSSQLGSASASPCLVIRDHKDYFTPSVYRTRPHSSTELQTRRQQQRQPNSLDSFGISLLNNLPQRRSYITVPRPKSTSLYSTKETSPCPTTIAAAESMTILFNQLASALKAEIKVVFDNDGSVDMLGGLNTG